MLPLAAARAQRLARADLEAVFELLRGNRRMLLRVLENPSLHEHESFTELLRASFHLLEELGLRGDFSGLPDSDVEHLEGDVRRVYRQLLLQWAEYLATSTRTTRTCYP